MYSRTTSQIVLLINLILAIILSSCSKEEVPEVIDPRDQFVGTYTSDINQWCNEKDTYTCEIKMGSTVNGVLWTNIIGEEGSDDDVEATISGNVITIPIQYIGTKEYEGEGVLSNSTISISTRLVSGVAEVFCEYEISLKQ